MAAPSPPGSPQPCQTLVRPVSERTSLQPQYAAWLAALPENLHDSALAEALQAIRDLDLTELQTIVPPRGFGRLTSTRSPKCHSETASKGVPFECRLTAELVAASVRRSWSYRFWPTPDPLFTLGADFTITGTGSPGPFSQWFRSPSFGRRRRGQRQHRDISDPSTPQSEWAAFTITATPTGGDWSFDLTGIPAAIPLNFVGEASQWFADPIADRDIRPDPDAQPGPCVPPRGRSALSIPSAAPARCPSWAGSAIHGIDPTAVTGFSAALHRPAGSDPATVPRAGARLSGVAGCGPTWAGCHSPTTLTPSWQAAGQLAAVAGQCRAGTGRAISSDCRPATVCARLPARDTTPSCCPQSWSVADSGAVSRPPHAPRR
jgi:hypothetical protein